MATLADKSGNRAREAASPPAAARPPRGLMVAALAFVVWLAVPWALILATTLEGEVVLAVCLLFSLIAFGVAGITVVQALRSWPGLRRGPEARGRAAAGASSRRNRAGCR